MPLKRLTTAPNLALATLWAEMLTASGIATKVERAFASGMNGAVPVDQTQPELWIEDDHRLEAARKMLETLRHPRPRHWACPGCHEVIDGPFERCWNCGTLMPEEHE